MVETAANALYCTLSRIANRANHPQPPESETSPCPTIDQYLESHAARFEEELCEFLRIPSVSADPSRRGDMHRAAEWVADQFRRLRFRGRGDPHGRPSAGLRRVAAGARRPDGPGLRPLRRAAARSAGQMDHAPLRADPPRRQPLRPRRHRRQGPDAHAHLKSAEAWITVEGRLPLNLKFLIEGEEEVGSDGLEQFLAEHADRLACDCVVISDGGQFAPGMPAITYGLRGIAYYELRVTGPEPRSALRLVRRLGHQSGQRPGADPGRPDRRPRPRARSPASTTTSCR